MASLNDIETKMQNIFDILDCRSVSTITGMLPITFKAGNTALINYRIYGTADGAGMRTKNLFNVENVTGQSAGVTITKIDEMTGSIEGETTSGLRYREIRWDPEFEEGHTYILNCYVNEVNGHASLCFRSKSNYNIVTSVSFKSTGLKSIQITYTSESYPGGIYISMLLNDSAATAGEINVSELMLRKEGITSDFIPYGYELPLTITNGTENKTSDIFIGDSKLGASDYVDYETQTITRGGISEPAPLPFPALETYIGTNTLDSTETLGEVTIKGKIKEVI